MPFESIWSVWVDLSNNQFTSSIRTSAHQTPRVVLLPKLKKLLLPCLSSLNFLLLPKQSGPSWGNADNKGWRDKSFETLREKGHLGVLCKTVEHDAVLLSTYFQKHYHGVPSCHVSYCIVAEIIGQSTQTSQDHHHNHHHPTKKHTTPTAATVFKDTKNLCCLIPNRGGSKQFFQAWGQR